MVREEGSILRRKRRKSGGRTRRGAEMSLGGCEGGENGRAKVGGQKQVGAADMEEELYKVLHEMRWGDRGAGIGEDGGGWVDMMEEEAVMVRRGRCALFGSRGRGEGGGEKGVAKIGG